MMKDILPYRGRSYLVLRYASMRRRRPFDVDDAFGFLNHKFKKKSDISRSVDTLSSHGFIKIEDGKWLITETGYNYLKLTARTYLGERVDPNVNA